MFVRISWVLLLFIAAPLDSAQACPAKIKQAVAKCDAYQQQRRWVKAADCQKRLVLLAKTVSCKTDLWKRVAHNYRRGGQSMPALLAFGALHNKAPDTTEGRLALLSIARLYETLAVYSEAARFYELFARSSKGKATRQIVQALLRAAELRGLLRHYGRAVKILRLLTSRYPKHSTAARFHYLLALALAKSGQPLQAHEHFQWVRQLASGATNSVLRISAVFNSGFALWRIRRTDALRWLTLAREQLNKSRSVLPLTAELKRMAARANYLQGVALIEQAHAIRLPGVPGELKLAVQRRMSLVLKAKRMFTGGTSYSGPRYLVNGACIAAYAYHQLYIALENAPQFQHVPTVRWIGSTRFTLRPVVINHYQSCLAVARRSKWFNVMTRQAARRLAQLTPIGPFLKELRPAPVFISTYHGPSRFDTRLPE